MRVCSYTNIVYKHQLNIIYWDRLRGEPKHRPIDISMSPPETIGSESVSQWQQLTPSEMSNRNQ